MYLVPSGKSSCGVHSNIKMATCFAFHVLWWPGWLTFFIFFKFIFIVAYDAHKCTRPTHHITVGMCNMKPPFPLNNNLFDSVTEQSTLGARSSWGQDILRGGGNCPPKPPPGYATTFTLLSLGGINVEILKRHISIGNLDKLRVNNLRSGEDIFLPIILWYDNWIMEWKYFILSHMTVLHKGGLISEF